MHIRALPQVPRWGGTINRTCSQNVVSRDGCVVAGASNNQGDRVIGRCWIMTTATYRTAWATAKVACVRREIPPHCRNHGRRLQECLDRKSTRLNSSHLGISYAVFCLK